MGYLLSRSQIACRRGLETEIVWEHLPANRSDSQSLLRVLRLLIPCLKAYNLIKHFVSLYKRVFRLLLFPIYANINLAARKFFNASASVRGVPNHNELPTCSNNYSARVIYPYIPLLWYFRRSWCVIRASHELVYKSYSLKLFILFKYIYTTLWHRYNTSLTSTSVTSFSISNFISISASRVLKCFREHMASNKNRRHKTANFTQPKSEKA